STDVSSVFILLVGIEYLFFVFCFFFFFQAEDGIRDRNVTGVQTCALPISAALAHMRAAGITGTIYTHPIGDRGHGAGPLIGLWDHQEGVPGRGDVGLLPNSWFSIELQATTPLPEWDNQPVRSAQEEDAELGADGQMRWILRRQAEFHIVK